MMSIEMVNVTKLHSAKRIDLKLNNVNWELIADIEYNGEVEPNKKLIVCDEDFKMIVNAGYYEVIEIW